ncbi:tRNA lysidine(34) synthetase TilS [bacterium]|nr:tRNA lysidine(34) synthetase TilS [bacterium]
MLSPGDRVVIAVSGGPDSICLLHLLLEISAEYNLSLFVAHLNHMLREEAIQEEEFVREVASKFSLPFYSERRDVKSLLKKGETLEEGARRVRYDFLKKACKFFTASKVALGHNADDLVETVLLNLIRGTGLKGLRGIPPLREDGGITFIRPLINIWRWEIEGYLKERGIPFVIDRSNLSLQFTRNKIRHRVIPLLEEINPKVKEAIHRLAQIAGEIYDYVQREAGREKEKLEKKEEPSVVKLKLKDFLLLHPALQKEIIRLLLLEFPGDVSGFGSEEIECILSLQEGKAMTLPNRIQVKKENDELIFRKLRWIRKIPFEIPLQVPGETFIPPMGLFVSAEIVEGRILIKDPSCLKVSLDMDKVRGKLVARNWREGDRMIPLGMKSAKKLQDIFVDCKVPREERHRIPLICDEEGIIWVVGVRLSERVKITEQTRRTLIFKAERKEEVEE